MKTVLTRSRMLRAHRLSRAGACARDGEQDGARRLIAVASGLLFLTFMVLMTWVGPARAGTYASSESEYWKVGTYDDYLSKACRRGVFNQSKSHRYNIKFVGEDGRAITGIAKKGWNLKDPRRLAEDGYTFHFFHDGYSDCKVYKALK